MKLQQSKENIQIQTRSFEHKFKSEFTGYFS